MPDLAIAMKYNPDLKVMLNAGYFDLATPFYEGIYEMQHLPIPAKLQKNIEFKFYESGHMVYAHAASLKALHDNVAAFILKTESLKRDRRYRQCRDCEWYGCLPQLAARSAFCSRSPVDQTWASRGLPRCQSPQEPYGSSQDRSKWSRVMG